MDSLCQKIIDIVGIFYLADSKYLLSTRIKEECDKLLLLTPFVRSLLSYSTWHRKKTLRRIIFCNSHVQLENISIRHKHSAALTLVKTTFLFYGYSFIPSSHFSTIDGIKVHSTRYLLQPTKKPFCNKTLFS